MLNIGDVVIVKKQLMEADVEIAYPVGTIGFVVAAEAVYKGGRIAYEVVSISEGYICLATDGEISIDVCERDGFWYYESELERTDNNFKIVMSKEVTQYESRL